MDTRTLLGKVQHHANIAHYELAGYWGGDVGVGVDEMSLLFHNQDELEETRQRSAEYGWEEFNCQAEVLTVTTEGSPWFGKSTPVWFSFWRHPDVTYRIEAMSYTPGLGGLPLHDHALLTSGGEPVIIHASFKPKDYDVFIKTQPGRPVLAYRNDYGQFSYWGRQATYLKPRVNLRDRLA